MKQGCPGYLFEEPDDILTDLRQPDDDIVHEDVIQGGVVSALPTGLRQNQVPAVHRGKEVLIFPRACGNKNQKGQVNTSKRYIFKRMLSAHSHPPLHTATGISSSVPALPRRDVQWHTSTRTTPDCQPAPSQTGCSARWHRRRNIPGKGESFAHSLHSRYEYGCHSTAEGPFATQYTVLALVHSKVLMKGFCIQHFLQVSMHNMNTRTHSGMLQGTAWRLQTRLHAHTDRTTVHRNRDESVDVEPP